MQLSCNYLCKLLSERYRITHISYIRVELKKVTYERTCTMLRGISTWDSHGVDFNTTPYTISAQIFGVSDKEAFLMEMLLHLLGKSWTSVQRTRRGHSGSTRCQSMGDKLFIVLHCRWLYVGFYQGKQPSEGHQKTHIIRSSTLVLYLLFNFPLVIFK